MEEYKYKDLVTVTPKKKENLKNILDVWMRWDSNDGDYIEKTERMNADILFNNKKLIYCLAYISCKYDFKGHSWNDNVFGHHITNNRDIDGLGSILRDNNFAVYCDWGMCHSSYGLRITYYDEEGTPWIVNFEDIIKRWEKMSYNEICKQINSIEYVVSD